MGVRDPPYILNFNEFIVVKSSMLLLKTIIGIFLFLFIY